MHEQEIESKLASSIYIIIAMCPEDDNNDNNDILCMCVFVYLLPPYMNRMV